MPFLRPIGEIVDLVRPLVHPFLEKDGEIRQLSRVIRAHYRQLQARNLAQTLANNPGEADGADNGGGDPAVEGIDVDPGPATGPGDSGGFLQDALDWFQDLF